MTGPELPFPAPLEVDDLLADAPWLPALELERVEQRRWTVLPRYLLAIPNLVVLWLAGIAAWVCVVPGWCTAVFTGRLPGWSHRFLTGYLVANVRLSGYLMLLTDQRPPIGFAADAAYPIWFPPPPRTRLSRVTVLLRLILAIPAMVVITVASTGWWVAGAEIEYRDVHTNWGAYLAAGPRSQRPWGRDEALTGLSLTLPAGQVTVLLGDHGSGKFGFNRLTRRTINRPANWCFLGRDANAT